MKRTTGRRILTLPEIQGISLVCDKHRGYPPCVFCMQQAFAFGQDSMETKEEPQVKTRERRVEGTAIEYKHGTRRWVIQEGNGGITTFGPPSEYGIPVAATLIIHEPIPEPTLVEAVEAFFNAISGEATLQAKRDMANALYREKQKSTR